MNTPKFRTIASIVMALVIIALLPFPINDITNAICYNPLSSLKSTESSKLLTECFYPKIYESNFTATRDEELNFGKYHLYYSLTQHTGNTFDYGLTLGATYRNGNCIDYDFAEFSLVANRYDVREKLNVSVTADETDMALNDYYYVYLKILNLDLFDGAAQAQSAYDYFVTSEGNHIAEWIGYYFESDMIWGIKLPSKTGVRSGPLNLFDLFTVLKGYQQEIDYLSKLGLFGDVSGFKFERMAQDAIAETPDYVMLYGRGEELREFFSRDGLSPVLIEAST